MKKLFISLPTLLLMAASTFAQNAKTSTIEINKIPQPCVSSEFTYPADIVEGALRKKFTDIKLGSGDKTKDGFRVYKGVVIPEISDKKIEFYFKVEDKKPVSQVAFLTSLGYDNFIKYETDSVTVNKTIAYLNNLLTDITRFDLNYKINKQNEVISDIEKKSKNTAKDGEGLVKDKAKVESKISKNTIELNALKTEMEAQQKALEVVKTKTATIEGMSALKKEVSKQEEATKKATKNYESAVKDSADYKEDLAKTEKAIVDNKTEQEKIKAELDTEKKKLEDLKTQLSNVK